MVAMNMRGDSGRSYLFEEVEPTRLPDVPGLVMLTDIRGGTAGSTVMISPTIGFVISLQRQAVALAGTERPTTLHSSRMLVCALRSDEATLRDAWADLRRGGAQPFQSQAKTEPFDMP